MGWQDGSSVSMRPCEEDLSLFIEFLFPKGSRRKWIPDSCPLTSTVLCVYHFKKHSFISMGDAQSFLYADYNSPSEEGRVDAEEHLLCPLIPALCMCRGEDQKIKAILGYRVKSDRHEPLSLPCSLINYGDFGGCQILQCAPPPQEAGRSKQ